MPVTIHHRPRLSPTTVDPSAFTATAAPATVQPAAAVRPTDAGERSLESIEQQHILSVLRGANWVIEGPRGAAKILGLHPNTLRSRLKKLGISRAHEGS